MLNSRTVTVREETRHVYSFQLALSDLVNNYYTEQDSSIEVIITYQDEYGRSRAKKVSFPGIGPS